MRAGGYRAGLARGGGPPHRPVRPNRTFARSLLEIHFPLARCGRDNADLIQQDVMEANVDRNFGYRTSRSHAAGGEGEATPAEDDPLVRPVNIRAGELDWSSSAEGAPFLLRSIACLRV